MVWRSWLEPANFAEARAQEIDECCTIDETEEEGAEQGAGAVAEEEEAASVTSSVDNYFSSRSATPLLYRALLTESLCEEMQLEHARHGHPDEPARRRRPHEFHHHHRRRGRRAQGRQASPLPGHVPVGPFLNALARCTTVKRVQFNL